MRLNAILEFANSCNADFIALQETKHPPNGFPFANRLAKEFGWSVVWSVSPPPVPATPGVPLCCGGSILAGNCLALTWIIGRMLVPGPMLLLLPFTGRLMVQTCLGSYAPFLRLNILNSLFILSIDSVIATSRLKPNSPIQSCVEHHLSVLGLNLIEWTDDGAFVAPKPRQPGLMRVLGPYLKNHRARGRALLVDAGPGAHAVTLAARHQCLLEISEKRFDAEGFRQVDLDASSQKPWTKWRNSLSHRHTTLLNVYRGGAAGTPTRKANLTGSDICPFCKVDRASMRHLWACCAHFNSFRAELQHSFNLEHSWWLLQPRVTSKSGWITFVAGANTLERAQRQIAACLLGIQILEALNWET